MSTSQTDNVLLNNRRAFSGRQSMEALINYARYASTHSGTRMAKSMLVPGCSGTVEFWELQLWWPFQWST